MKRKQIDRLTEMFQKGELSKDGYLNGLKKLK